jgi:hypothetical protein
MRFMSNLLLLLIVAGAGWAGGMWWERVHPRTITINAPSLFPTSTGEPVAKDVLPFDVRPLGQNMGGLSISRAWLLTSTEVDPLTINRVTLNGEYVAPIGKMMGTALFLDSNRSFPVTLSVGDTLVIFEYHVNAVAQSYSKEVVFIDFDTSRGRIRYKPVRP